VFIGKSKCIDQTPHHVVLKRVKACVTLEIY